MTDTIKAIEDDILYSATIRFYSKGKDDQVTSMFEVSHVLAEDFDGDMPAAYSIAQEILLGLRARSTLYAASTADQEYLGDPDVPDKDKVERILDSAKAQEEALNAVLN